MKLKVWGARGSVPAPGPETMRYGGNTSCVQVTLSDGSTLILDAGTGIRNLGLGFPPTEQPIHILLTHLHLDHIQGLMFFAPAFRPGSEIIVWGPPSPEASLEDRVARYISAPLAPVEVRELPSLVCFREADQHEWTLGGARITTQAVNHRGPTLGYRIEDGDTTLCYIPDHEPGLGAPLAELDDDWISGFALARDATLLIHDCQYTDTEYPRHIGWGHAPVADALAFGRRTGARRVLMFHHDPLHSDAFLDRLHSDAGAAWAQLGGDPNQIEFASESLELVLDGSTPPSGPGATPLRQPAPAANR